MPWPTIDPTLAAYVAASANTTPADSINANELAQVDKQTREYIYNYLSTKFNVSTVGSATAEFLKAGVVEDATVAGKVKGTTANSGGTQQGIVQGTVSTPDMRDLAISTAKIADSAITTAKIADTNVTTGKLVDLAVTAAKIAANTITAAQMAADSVDATVLKDDVTGAAGAVTTDHLRTNAVTTAKIIDGAVTKSKIYLATTIADILVADSNKQFSSVPLSGDATISSTGVITLASNGISVLEEKAANGVDGGGSTATTWVARGNTVPWVIKFQNVASMVNVALGSGKISFAAAGSFIVRAWATGYKVGKHVCRLNRYNSGNVSQETFNGSAQQCPAAAVISNTSYVEAKIAMGATDYLMLEHYCELTEAADGFGKAVGSGSGNEIYAIIEIQKVTA